MIPRRAVLFGLGASALLIPFRRASAIPVDERLAFRIARKGDTIGRHRLSFAREGDALTIEIAVEIDVRFGPLPLYRYRHTAVEKWIGPNFISIDARTDDNGDAFRVTMTRGDGGFQVSGSKGDYLAPPETHPATHWNRRQLSGPMVNTQTGELMRPDIVDHGSDTFRLPDGTSTSATRYTLRDEETFDLWYDAEDRWVGLAFKGKDGADIRYLWSQA